jgi:hypothetical protein
VDLAVGLILFLGMAAVVWRAKTRPNMPDPSPRDVALGPGGTAEQMTALLQQCAPGHATRVDLYQDSGGGDNPEHGVELTVEGVEPAVSMARADAGEGSGITGDPELDVLVRMDACPATARAVLDGPARESIRGLLRGTVRIAQLWIESGRITVRVSATGFTGEHPGLASVARSLGALAAKIAPPHDPVPRLVSIALRDPQPAVRLNALNALTGDFSTDPRTTAAVREALDDRSTPVRLAAAQAAGADGRATLIAVATDPLVEDTYAATAITALGGALPLDRIEGLVGEASGPPNRPATTTALLAALGRNPDARAFDVLVRLVRNMHHTFAVAAVNALVAIPRPRAEAVLIETATAPDRWRRPWVAAAVHALAAHGTADAVLTLKEVAARHGGAIASDARQAIAEIQSRLAGSRGSLALAGAEEGTLSFATDESGQVSIARPEEDG